MSNTADLNEVDAPPKDAEGAGSDEEDPLKV
jgi:hypothetical protein